MEIHTSMVGSLLLKPNSSDLTLLYGMVNVLFELAYLPIPSSISSDSFLESFDIFLFYLKQPIRLTDLCISEQQT